MRNIRRGNQGLYRYGRHATHYFAMRQIGPYNSGATPAVQETHRRTSAVLRELLQEGPLKRKRHSSHSGNGTIALLGLRAEKRNDPYFRRLIDGIYEAASTHNLQIVLQDLETPIDPHELDGVLIASHRITTPLPIPVHLPCVSMLYQLEGIPSVLVDEFNAGAIATQHLLDLGHRRIAFLANPSQPQAAHRVFGYCHTLQKADIMLENAWVQPLRETSSPYDYFREWGYSSMREWLQTTWREHGFSALIAQNDWVAAGAVRALQEKGLRIPHDVAVIGFDNLDICRQIKPVLSSVEAPLREIGRQSIELLLRLADGSQPECETILLPPRLRIRQSTADHGT